MKTTENVNLRERIRNKFRNGYMSNHEVDDTDIDIYIAGECHCCMCHEDMFEMDDYPIIIDGEIWCEQCDDEHHYTRCAICEDRFENTSGPENYRFVVSAESAKEIGARPGIYQALKFPFFYGNIVSGFEGFFEGDIRLLRELDINSIQRKLHPGHGSDIGGDQICDGCCDKYLRKKYEYTEYLDKYTRIHRNIYERGVIAAGK